MYHCLLIWLTVNSHEYLAKINNNISFIWTAETKAKVIEKFDEGGDEDDDAELLSGNLRRRSVAILADGDRRYCGKATSRKDLQKELDGSGEVKMFNKNRDTFWLYQLMHNLHIAICA